MRNKALATASDPANKALQKARLKAEQVAILRAPIADEVTSLLKRRQNWRDEAVKPDYTNQTGTQNKKNKKQKTKNKKQKTKNLKLVRSQS